MKPKVNINSVSQTERFSTPNEMYSKSFDIFKDTSNCIKMLMKEACLTKLNIDYDITEAFGADSLTLPYYDRRCDCDVNCHCSEISIKDGALHFTLNDDVCDEVTEDNLDLNDILAAYQIVYALLTDDEVDYDEVISSL